MTTMYSRILELPDSSFFLLGPRGTGKTTWLRQKLPNAYWVDLLDEGRYQSYLGNSSLFSQEMNTLPKGSWVVVDEVQRLPSLLNEVHRFIESRHMKFALTGSSARKLRREGVNLLAGRAFQKLFFPLHPIEIGKDFDLDRALQFGTLPLVWGSKDPKQTLQAYTQMYLKEEIQAEALVRNLPGFARFLPVAALFHGQTLNISNVARDVGSSRTTVSGFMEVLEDTLLATRLPAFETKLRVREKKHPKLYWIDPGIVRAVKRDLSDVGMEEKGSLFEGFVFNILRMEQAYHGEIDLISYWSPADAQKTEVDFLVQLGKSKVAIEVKCSTQLRPENFLGLKAISALPGLKRRILIYNGKTPLKTDDGIEVWPFAHFVSCLSQGEVW
jgi:uncharacterized protein